MNANELSDDARELIHRHVEGELERATRIAKTHGLPLQVLIGREDGQWSLTLRAGAPDGQLAYFAHYLVPADDPTTPALVSIFLSDLFASARARLGRIRRGLEQWERAQRER